MTSEDAVLKGFPAEFHPHRRSGSLKRKKVEAHRGLQGSVRGGSAGEGGGADVGCLLFKARFSPRHLCAIHQQLFQGCEKSMCSALQTVHNDGGWGKKRKKKKKLNCNRIDLFKYNNAALQRGGGWGAQTKPDWQYETTSSN